MSDFLPFIVVGLSVGAVYGLAGVGLVLTYKTSGIFNFGFGAVAALAAFLFYFLNSDHGVPWPIAAIITVGLFAVVVGLAMEVLAGSLANASETLKVVTTVGMILIVVAIGSFWHNVYQPTFSHFLPLTIVRIAGVNVTYEQIILFVFSAGASGVLWWFFKSMRLGLVMRGIVDSPDLVSMSGDNPRRIRRWAWIIGMGFAATAGLLLSPAQPVNGVNLTILVFATFGAAAIGFFDNLPLTFVGGLIIGVTSALVDKYAGSLDWLGGIPPSLPFIFLFVVLILTPRRRLLRRRVRAQVEVHEPYQAPLRLRLLAGAVAVVLLALVPQLQPDRLATWSKALLDIILFLSLGVLVRKSGQISLCHLTFAAVGAAAFGHFATGSGMPWLLALVLASLVAVPIGALVAIPAARVSGVYLALATLGFGIIAQYVFYGQDFMFGTHATGTKAPRPHVTLLGQDLSTNQGFYYLLLVITVLVTVGLTVLTSGRLGRLMQAMGDSQVGLETRGTSTTVLKVIVFCITASVASMAGALTAMLFRFAVPTNFQPFDSVTMVVLVVIIAIGSPWYAVLGAVSRTVIGGYVEGPNMANALLLLFGVSAVLAVYTTRFSGAPQWARDFLDKIGGRTRRRAKLADAKSSTEAVPRNRDAVAARDGLDIRNVSVTFGGVTAVDDVSLRAPMGHITGLIGPNGAGKTTTFNVCSGLQRPASGSVHFHGVDITHQSPSRRARRGLGRTFQRPELFDSLTVRQNVSMGLEASQAGARPSTQLASTRRKRRAIAAATEESLEMTGIRSIAETQVGLLSIGQRRLVELATVLAGPFDLLLLDEPSSGLDGNETEMFGQVLRTVVKEWGRGILLVEHDMTLVHAVCDHVYVLDFGTLIFEGSPAEMVVSHEVREAYLGSTADDHSPDSNSGAPVREAQPAVPVE